jgi:AmmeMemoRadiSam system protein A
VTAAANDPARPTVPPEYTRDERKQLLRLAHDAIWASLDARELNFTPPTEHFAQQRGAFTTLHLHGHLRGCVGYIIAAHSLWRTVAETAVAAAFDDSRFGAVKRDEAALLEIEISVLSLIFPIRPEEVIVGVHGLLVSEGMNRGLLLPQVPIEQGWDRETFLDQTCIKAGLPPGAWRQHAQLQAFTAEVFGENDPELGSPLNS